MKKAIVFCYLGVVLMKWIIAARLDLFADEAFYWQCAQRPDMAYMDLPLLTAMMVKLGTFFLGDTTLGVRLPFLVVGMAFPLAIYHLARPMVGSSDAWVAAAASLFLPGLGLMGFAAVPDVLLLLLTALFLLGFERATRTGSLRAWLLAGCCAALGLATHYRFVLAPGAAFLYLVLSPHGRTLWRHKRLWLAVAVALPGLLPPLLYNLKHDWAPLGYFLGVRHAVVFRPDELLKHLAEQALVVSPVLYIALWGVLVMLGKKARSGDDRAVLFGLFALAPMGLYLLASLMKDTGPQSMHWPLPGYLPLLVWFPVALRGFLSKPGPIRKGAAVLAPAFGVVLLGLVLMELATGLLGLGSVRKPFLGWSEASARVRQELRKLEEQGRPVKIVVADNYKLGSNLEFQLGRSVRVFILAHSKNFEHGRQLQFDLWDMGEKAIPSHGGDSALLVVQWSEVVRGTEERWAKHVCGFFEHTEPIGELRVMLGGGKDKLFRFFHGNLKSR